jgi:hypothetical protein
MKISKIGLIGILILVIIFSMAGYLREGATGITADNIVSNYKNDIKGLYNKNNTQNCTDRQAKDVLDDLNKNFNTLNNDDQTSLTHIKNTLANYKKDNSMNNIYLLLNNSIDIYNLKLPVLKSGGGISQTNPPASASTSAPTSAPTAPASASTSAPTSAPTAPASASTSAPTALTSASTSAISATSASTAASTPPVYNTSYILKNDIDPLFSSTNQLNPIDYNTAYKTLQQIHKDINKIPTPDPILISIDNEITHLPNGPNIYRDSTTLLNKDIATLEPTASRPPLVLPANYK